MVVRRRRGRTDEASARPEGGRRPSRINGRCFVARPSQCPQEIRPCFGVAGQRTIKSQRGECNEKNSRRLPITLAQQTSPGSRHRIVNPSKESSTMHAIRKLRESGHATAADYETMLAANVVFHSPVLIRTIEGRTTVAKIFAASTTLREGAYTGEWKLDDRRTLLRWKGTIQGHELERLDIIEENDEGVIVDRTIAFRPMPAAKLFRDAMRAAIGSSVPDDFWEYSN